MILSYFGHDRGRKKDSKAKILRSKVNLALQIQMLIN